MRSRVRAAVMAAALMGSGTWARAQCTKDTDCKGDRVCDAGQCTAPAPASPELSPAPGAAAAESANPATAAPAPPMVQLAPVQPVAPLGPLAPTDQPMRRRSTPMMVGGIVMTASGPVVWLVGLILVTSAHMSCLGNSSYHGDTYGYSAVQASELNACRNRAANQSYGVLIGGAVLIGAGIPMIVYGAKKVPDTSLTASVAPWLAPGQAGLQLRVDL